MQAERERNGLVHSPGGDVEYYERPATYEHQQSSTKKGGKGMGQKAQGAIGKTLGGIQEGAVFVPEVAGQAIDKTLFNRGGLLQGVGVSIGMACMIVGAYHVIPKAGGGAYNAGRGAIAGLAGYQVPDNAPTIMRTANAIGGGFGTAVKVAWDGTTRSTVQTIQVDFRGDIPAAQPVVNGVTLQRPGGSALFVMDSSDNRGRDNRRP